MDVYKKLEELVALAELPYTPGQRIVQLAEKRRFLWVSIIPDGRYRGGGVWEPTVILVGRDVWGKFGQWLKEIPASEADTLPWDRAEAFARRFAEVRREAALRRQRRQQERLARHLASLRELAHAVAPELAERPLYILPLRLVSPESNCWGAAARRGDLHYRHVIGDAWRGRGPCLLIQDALPQRVQRSVLLHELGHVFQWPVEDEAPVERPSRRERFERAVADWVMTAEGTPADYVEAHDWRWTRAVVHLRYRARRLGARLPYAAIERAYRRLMGDEPRLWLDKPIRWILLQRGPEALRECWAGFVANWLAGGVTDDL